MNSSTKSFGAHEYEMAAYTTVAYILLYCFWWLKECTSRQGCPIGQIQIGTSAVHVNVIGWALEGPCAKKRDRIREGDGPTDTDRLEITQLEESDQIKSNLQNEEDAMPLPLPACRSLHPRHATPMAVWARSPVGSSPSRPGGVRGICGPCSPAHFRGPSGR